MDDQIIPTNTTHGRSKTPEYSAWSHMKERCLKPNTKHFHRYGGRGITVCTRWIASFDNFLADMGSRPSDKHSLDRIDNNDNYTPSNCQWSTHTEQMRNQETYGKSGVKGVYIKGRNTITAQINVNRETIYLGSFATIEEATDARREAEAKYW